MELTEKSAMAIVEAYKQINSLNKTLGSPPYVIWVELLESGKELSKNMDKLLGQSKLERSGPILEDIIVKIEYFCRLSSKLSEYNPSPKLKAQFDMLSMQLKSLRNELIQK